MKLSALRGAITVDANEADAILSATEELVREVMERNELEPGARWSAASSPARTTWTPSSRPWRRAGSGSRPVPLLCAREIDVPGALPRVIRLLLHCYADPERRAAQHVYLREAESLRRDLEGAQ